MIRIISILNGQPIPNTEKTLPKTYKNISNPKLNDLINTGEFEEYIHPNYDSETESLGDYIKINTYWTKQIIKK